MENTKEHTIMSYDQKELQMGTAIEHEHTHDDRLAAKIAADHLREDPHYYTKLNAAGLEQEGAMTPLERGMEEVSPLKSDELGSDLEECGADVAVIKISAVSTGPKKVGGEAQPAKPLTSSNLASGTPRPLTSDTLQAPKGNNTVGVGKTPPKMGGKDSANGDLNVKGTKLKDEAGNGKPNNIEYGKTPSMPGSNNNSDPTDFFGKQISKALKDEVPRTREFIPANVSEGWSSFFKDDSAQDVIKFIKTAGKEELMHFKHLATRSDEDAVKYAKEVNKRIGTGYDMSITKKNNPFGMAAVNALANSWDREYARDAKKVNEGGASLKKK